MASAVLLAVCSLAMFQLTEGLFIYTHIYTHDIYTHEDKFIKKKCGEMIKVTKGSQLIIAFSKNLRINNYTCIHTKYPITLETMVREEKTIYMSIESSITPDGLWNCVLTDEKLKKDSCDINFKTNDTPSSYIQIDVINKEADDNRQTPMPTDNIVPYKDGDRFEMVCRRRKIQNTYPFRGGRRWKYCSKGENVCKIVQVDNNKNYTFEKQLFASNNGDTLTCILWYSYSSKTYMETIEFKMIPDDIAVHILMWPFIGSLCIIALFLIAAILCRIRRRERLFQDEASPSYENLANDVSSAFSTNADKLERTYVNLPMVHDQRRARDQQEPTPVCKEIQQSASFNNREPYCNVVKVVIPSEYSTCNDANTQNQAIVNSITTRNEVSNMKDEDVGAVTYACHYMNDPQKDISSHFETLNIVYSTINFNEAVYVNQSIE